tara:strand:- start:3933 stop:4340 length:408 start_codon:yes stop_codon:yes gene_type:complete
MPFYTPASSTYETHRDVLISSIESSVLGSYTLDADYVTATTLADGKDYKIVFEGQVLAMNPANGQAVPNYTSYGFGELGVLYNAMNTDNEDPVATVILDGWVNEGVCTDNGVFGTVLAATKTALTTVQFVDRTTL